MTLGYFLRFDQVITQQYPENRKTLKLPPRFRGKIELVRDPQTGRHHCGACGLCVRVCPNGSIEIASVRDPESKKLRLTRYQYHFGRCSLCGLCIEACRPEALKMSPQYETAVYDKSDLVEDLIREEPAPTASPPPADSPAKEVSPAEGENPPPNPTSQGGNHG